ncbi:hypothetical protein NDK43_22010 [Neobacillus pocheonensis]|uniref:Uncharacterized protein n=1 Tax=Neobacillus pocheonensis TaxID=363869 RepID=A0ABT0WEP1_9BACI|nr:hypothetical protein [Neobacillus pocheonensis]
MSPNTAVGFTQLLFIDTGGTSATASSDPRALIVTVSGDVEKSGDKILVSLTGGFSSDGNSLDISEPTMFYRHEDFVEVNVDHHHHYHDESSD